MDVVFSVRGVPVQLSRRTYRERSAVRRKDVELGKPIKLLTAFIIDSGRLDTERPSLGFALRIGVRVPEYEGEDSFRVDYYEGSVLFADKLNVEVTPEPEVPLVRYGWDRRTPNRAPRPLSLNPVSEVDGEGEVGEVPFGSGRNVRPGIQAKIRFTVKAWNR